MGSDLTSSSSLWASTSEGDNQDLVGTPHSTSSSGGAQLFGQNQPSSNFSSNSLMGQFMPSGFNRLISPLATHGGMVSMHAYRFTILGR